MIRSAGFTLIRRLAAGLLPLATVIACDSPLDLPPPGGQPTDQLPVATIEIQAPSGALAVGQAVPLGIRVLAADGALLVRPVVWTSSDSLVVSVSAAGVVSARANGTAQVTARVASRRRKIPASTPAKTRSSTSQQSHDERRYRRGMDEYAARAHDVNSCGARRISHRSSRTTPGRTSAITSLSSVESDVTDDR